MNSKLKKIIKIANKLDENGYHVAADLVTRGMMSFAQGGDMTEQIQELEGQLDESEGGGESVDPTQFVGDSGGFLDPFGLNAVNRNTLYSWITRSFDADPSFRETFARAYGNGLTPDMEAYAVQKGLDSRKALDELGKFLSNREHSENLQLILNESGLAELGPYATDAAGGAMESPGGAAAGGGAAGGAMMSVPPQGGVYTSKRPGFGIQPISPGYSFPVNPNESASGGWVPVMLNDGSEGYFMPNPS